ncbi:MAG: lytic murein transglycosylase [Sulfitobacter sp.]|jgi:membrane-bound lytic murein transglycosylase B
MTSNFKLSLCLSLALPVMAGASGPDTSSRPPEERKPVQAVVPMGDKTAEGLSDWVHEFRARALARGITAQTFDSAFKDVSYDAQVIRRDRNQSEFTKTIWEYLDTAVSDLRISNGRNALAKWDKTLSDIEARYGVEKQVVTAIWGLESAYGTFRGNGSVINSLTTLAYDARRADFFEAELLDALKILQSGDTPAARMTGSWAGAMGHTQFMPSSFQAHAVDYDGDGRRNIWEDDPRDALASTAAYLKHFGWVKGQPWGVEVQLPKGFDYLMARRDLQKLPSDWAKLGVNGVAGRVPDYGPASVLLPGGSKGAAFLVFANFAVLEKYNTADAYVIGVGHLSDRIGGAPPIRHSWPRSDRALTYDERIELQKRLTAAGFDTVKIDAKMGPLTINAVRKFQSFSGVLPDGYPSLHLLDRLRAL